jgi:threonine synthase
MLIRMSDPSDSHYISGLTCVSCGADYPPNDAPMTCSQCPPGQGILDVRYHMDAVAESLTSSALNDREHDHWRYAELLPLTRRAIPQNWPVGWTPVIETPRLAEQLGLQKLYLKDDARNPSGSFKDRASSVGVARALSEGHEEIACASTGNAATSLAACCAALGARARIFVPQNVPEGKLAQMLAYGATVVKVLGTYAQAYDLCQNACAEFGWYNRNCAVNPYLVEGKKTAGLEIAEQCADRMPDWVVVSVGDGCTLAGIHKGLTQMHELGLCPAVPRMLGVQAEGAAPVLYALEHDRLPEIAGSGTLADSINVDVPRNWRKAVNAVRASNGAIVTVSDDEILEALYLCAKETGLFAEPAAAAAVAGAAVAVRDKVIRKNERVLAVITGSGLKDIRSALRAVPPPIEIKPELGALTRALNRDLKRG